MPTVILHKDEIASKIAMWDSRKEIHYLTPEYNDNILCVSWQHLDPSVGRALCHAEGRMSILTACRCQYVEVKVIACGIHQKADLF